MPEVKDQTPEAWAANTHALTRKGSGGSATPSLMTLGSAAAATLDTDASMTADSDGRVPSQKAVKAAVAGDALVVSIGGLSAHARRAFLEVLLEELAVDDGVLQIETGAVSVAPVVDSSGAIDRFWTLDGEGNFLLATASEARTLMGVSATADVVLKSLFDANTMVYATTDNTPTALTVAASRIVGRKASGDISAMTGAETGALLAGPIEYPIDAGAMIPRTTSGAAFVTTETTTNKVMSYVLAFDTAADEFAQFSIELPKGFNAGTVTARFKWSHPATTTNFDVTWAIQARAFTNDDALDQAFGTAVVVTDAGGTTGDIYTSPETGAITIAGTPTGQKRAIFQVYRDVDGNGTAGNDDLAVDAYLHSVVLTLTMSALTDA